VSGAKAREAIKKLFEINGLGGKIDVEHVPLDVNVSATIPIESVLSDRVPSFM
jgi:hypothetical protein